MNTHLANSTRFILDSLSKVISKQKSVSKQPCLFLNKYLNYETRDSCRVIQSR
jgi:hypothetical protein